MQSTPSFIYQGQTRFQTLILPILKPRKVDSTWTAQSYSYQQLPTQTSIRVLSLLPSEVAATSIAQDGEDPIRCSIKTVDLESHPVYEALSYAWGDPLVFYRDKDDIVPAEDWYKPTYEIICDGQAVSITANLFAALLARRRMVNRLSGPDGKTLARQMEQMGYVPQEHVWIDAVCINQSDLDEREAQVAIMARIYSQAAVVNAWLGGEDEASLDIHPVMRHLSSADAVQAHILQAEQLRGMSLADTRLYQILNIPYIQRDEWVSLWAFFNRSWFRRAWVVQEMGLAKKAVMSVGLKTFLFDLPYGVHMMLRDTRLVHEVRNLGEKIADEIEKWGSAPLIPLKPLYRSQPAMRWDHNHFLTIGEVRSGFGIEGKDYRRDPTAEPYPLRFLLTSFRSTEAKDPRDKIYAFLGISKELSLLSPTARHDRATALAAPSYQKPVFQVFLDTMRFDVENTQTLDMLSLVQSSRFRKITSLPSWLPDFSAPPYPNSLMSCFPNLIPPWNASLGLGPAQPAFPSSPDSTHTICKSSKKQSVSFTTLGRVFRRRIQPTEPPKKQASSTPLSQTLLATGLKIATVVETAAYDGTIIPLHSPLASLLGALPDTSPMPSPPTTDRLRNYTLIGHPRNNPPEDPAQRAQRVATLPPEGSPPTRTNQTSAEMYWRTLLCDCIWGHCPAPKEKCSKALRYLVKKTANTPGVHIGVSEEEKMWAEEMKFRMDVNSYQRKMFRTDGGMLGNGFEDVMVGDEVWILAGASMPLVLRNEGEGKHRVVGEAYVHGIMHGEGVRGRKGEVVTLV